MPKDSKGIVDKKSKSYLLHYTQKFMHILFLNLFLPTLKVPVENVRSVALMSAIAKAEKVTALVCTDDIFAQGSLNLDESCESYYQIQLKKTVLKRLSGHFGIENHHQKFHQRAIRKTLQHLLATFKFDIIHCGHPALMPNLPANLRTPIVLQQDAVDYAGVFPEFNPQVLQSGGLASGKRDRRFLEALWQQSQFVIVPTNSMKVTVQEISPSTDVAVVRQAIKTAGKKKYVQFNSAKTLVITGEMNRPELVESIKYFAANIWKHIRRADKDVRLFIAGHNPPDEIRQMNRLQNIYVMGSGPDVQLFMREASIVIIPEKKCAGTNMPILQAMAMSKPVVCFKDAVSNMDVGDGVHVHIAHTDHEFVEKIRNLLADAALREKTGRQARDFIEKQHSPDIVGEQLLSIYSSILDDVERAGPIEAQRVSLGTVRQGIPAPPLEKRAAGIPSPSTRPSSTIE